MFGFGKKKKVAPPARGAVSRRMERRNGERRRIIDRRLAIRWDTAAAERRAPRVMAERRNRPVDPWALGSRR